MHYTIDAAGKKLGRVASVAASILMGKKTPAFRKNVSLPFEVTIANVSKADFREKKLRETTHAKYTGYPGGLRFESNKDISEAKGFPELFRMAVRNMLPPNKLRNGRMKRLTISE